MIKQAINELYTNFPYEAKLKYSGKFKPYRANVRLRGVNIQFNLSRKWKTVSKDIQMGLIQELLLKILKNKLKPIRTNTSNIELYNIFIKKLHIGIPKIKRDPILEESFNRVNEKYFFGLLEISNLEWGSKTATKLGSYEYATDTISISTIFKDEPGLLDYVMYHEMLHKKHKFYSKNGRSYHHTAEFKRKEKEFENSEEIEQRIKRIARKAHTRGFIRKLFFI